MICRILFSLATILVTQNVMAELRFESGRSFSVYGRTAEVDFYCQNDRMGRWYVGSETCENFDVFPRRLDRLVGTMNSEIEKVVLMRGDEGYTYRYRGKEGATDRIDVSRMLDNGHLIFTYRLLSKKVDGASKVIEEGTIEIDSTYNVVEDWWPAQYLYQARPNESCHNIPTEELCRAYFRDRP